MCARILVVDDDPTNIHLLTGLLRNFGHTALSASGGEEAIVTAAHEEIDCVLCDVQMPEVDGYAVLNRLRDAGKRIPVVAVSALAMVGDREKILAAGFDGYMEKPIDPERFVCGVEALIETYTRARIGTGGNQCAS